MFTTRSGAVRLAILVVIGLILLKTIVSIITGSLSILAQAADSFLDLVALSITLLAVRVAVKPADGEHPFGHGKVENMAAIAQAVLIFVAAGLIIHSAVERIATGATLTLTEAGIGVMAVSIIASILLSRHLLRVARTVDSLALEGMAYNIRADVYSATAVLTGMLVIRLFNFTIIDAVLAMLVALYILKVAYDVVRKSFGGLLDVKLPEEEERIIKATLTEYRNRIVDFHKLRTRKSGTQRYIDLHVVTPSHISVAEAHQLCDSLEHEIAGKLTDSSLTIHIEPCDEGCNRCTITCEFRRESHPRRP